MVVGVSSARLRRLHARRRSRCSSGRHFMALTSRRPMAPRRSCHALRSAGGCWRSLVVALGDLAVGLQAGAPSESVAPDGECQLALAMGLGHPLSPRRAWPTPPTPTGIPILGRSRWAVPHRFRVSASRSTLAREVPRQRRKIAKRALIAGPRTTVELARSGRWW
jgi:hypothetical protein